MDLYWTPVFAKSFVNQKRGDVTLKIDYISFVGWRDAPQCPTPSSASVRINVTATPVGGGSPFVVGQQTFSAPTPDTPGLQPDASVDYLIADGTLPFDDDYVLDITGTCEVVFVGSGPGSGTFADTTSVESCLVRPSPLDEDTPRLALCCLNKSGRLAQIAERGDQRATYYILSNNDPKHAVTVDLESSGLQIANFPDGFSAADLPAAYAAGAGSISNPIEGTDTFVGVFEEDIPANGIVGNPLDPGAVDPLTITRDDVVLQPYESRIVCIVTRSNGMCADGSCSRRNLKVTGQFADGTPALACAVSAHVVLAGAARQTPRCLYTDTIKVGANDAVAFSSGRFGSQRGPIDHAETHHAGNVPTENSPFPGRGATELRGSNVATGGFPQQATDTIAEQPFLVDPFFDVSYDLQFATLGPQPQQVSGTTIIRGIDQLPQGVPFEAQVYGLQGRGDIIVGPSPTGLDAVYDVAQSQVMLLNTTGPQPQILYDGSISGLDAFVQGSPDVFPVPGTCRSFAKSGDTAAKYSVLGPHLRTVALGKKDRAEFFGGEIAIPIANGQDQNPSPWQATRQGIGLQPEAASGTDTVPIELVALDLQSVDPLDVTIFGKKNRVRDFQPWVCVSCPGGLNTVDSPFLVRVVNQKGKPSIRKDFAKRKSFKKVFVGNTEFSTITLRNKGKGPVSFRLPDTLPAPFAWVDDVSGFHTVYPKGEMEVGLSYTPVGEEGKTKGKDKETVLVERSDKDKPLKLKLKGDWRELP